MKHVAGWLSLALLLGAAVAACTAPYEARAHGNQEVSTPICGDGLCERGETYSGCPADCPYCGNGVLDPGEQCDDATANSDSAPDACRRGCLTAHCGDGVVDSGEQCDDADSNSDSESDACRSDCQPARCGDGVVDDGEQCDDADSNSDACRSDCRLPRCGDGVVDGAEQCDPGPILESPGCRYCSPDGEFRINTYTTDAQRDPEVAMAGGGGFVVVWNSVGQLGGDNGVYGQLFATSGSRVGSEIQISTGGVEGWEHPAAGISADGSFVVSWLARRPIDPDLAARRFDAAGNPMTGEYHPDMFCGGFQCEDSSPALGMAPDGRHVIVRHHGWFFDPSPDHGTYMFLEGGTYGRLFNAAGSQLGAVITPGMHKLTVGQGTDGRFVIAGFRYEGSSDAEIYARRFDSSGSPVGGEIHVNTFTTGHQRYVAVGMAASGDFVAVWDSEDQDGDGLGVFAQRFDASGLPQGGELQVNTYTAGRQRYPDVAVAPDGRFVVVWESEDQDGDSYGVFAQRYDAAGAPLGSEFQVNFHAVSYQGDPSVAAAADGSVVVVWTSCGGQDGDSCGVFGQRYDAAGNPLGPQS